MQRGVCHLRDRRDIVEKGDQPDAHRYVPSLKVFINERDVSALSSYGLLICGRQFGEAEDLGSTAVFLDISCIG